MKLHDFEAIQIEIWIYWGYVEKVSRMVCEMVENLNKLLWKCWKSVRKALENYWESIEKVWESAGENVKKVLSVQKMESLEEGLWEFLD